MYRSMNGSNEAASNIPQSQMQQPPPPQPQSLIFTSAAVPVQQSMQMWPQQQQTSNISPQPRPAIFLTNLTNQAQLPMTSSNTPLVFASPSADGTCLIRAPVPTVATSQLGNPLNGPTAPFVMAVNSTPTDALATASTPVIVTGNSDMFNGSVPTITTSHSTSVIIDQAQTPAQVPKVVSSATISSTQIFCEAPSSASQASAVTQQVLQTTSHTLPVFTSKSLTDLVKETDPHLELDEETEEVLMTLSEEFIENVADKAIRLATHRGSSVVEAKDVKFCLDNDWNIFVPGYASAERTWKRPFALQAHKQRLAIAKKQIKRT